MGQGLASSQVLARVFWGHRERPERPGELI